MTREEKSKFLRCLRHPESWSQKQGPWIGDRELGYFEIFSPPENARCCVSSTLLCVAGRDLPHPQTIDERMKLTRYRQLYREFVEKVLKRKMTNDTLVCWNIIEKWNESTTHKDVRRMIRRMPVE